MQLDRDDLVRIMAQHVYAICESDDGRYREHIGAERNGLEAAADAIMNIYGWEDDV